MFANLLPFLRRRSDISSEGAFVQEVKIHRPVGRSKRSEFWIVLGWFLIGLKTWGTFWLVENYQMPFNSWWIVLPTLFAATVCTWIYLRRN